MIKNITVCQITDLYFFAVDKKIADWNEIQDIIFHTEGNTHHHWFKDAFVITKNFFNKKYMDDAYGLFWHPKVRKMVKDFMKHHKLDRFLVCTTKNSSLLEL